ncbi:MAG: hypothetical protein IKX33_04615 [Prevotella sp.]|nr:hypothetical protein [Prevotella sp.]
MNIINKLKNLFKGKRSMHINDAPKDLTDEEQSSTHMEDVIFLGTRQNGTWRVIGYDIQYHYGYETMLKMLDAFVKEYDIDVERIVKSELAGMPGNVIWEKDNGNNLMPLSEMEALKDECGEVSIGGFAKKMTRIRIYITMTNQTSIVVIQIPDFYYSEKIQKRLNIVAKFIQSSLLSQ